MSDKPTSILVQLSQADVLDIDPDLQDSNTLDFYNSLECSKSVILVTEDVGLLIRELKVLHEIMKLKDKQDKLELDLKVKTSRGKKKL